MVFVWIVLFCSVWCHADQQEVVTPFNGGRIKVRVSSSSSANVEVDTDAQKQTDGGLPSLSKANQLLGAQALSDPAWTRRIALGVGFSVCAYTLVYVRLKVMAASLALSGSWAAWRFDVPLSALQALPLDVVASELYSEIQLKYNTDGAISQFEACRLFMQDVQKEIAYGAHFYKIHEWLERLKLAWLFPEHRRAREQAIHAGERLMFLKYVLTEIIEVRTVKHR